MTPEKQRIKIAEACGWILNPECDFLGKAFPQCWTHDDYNMVFHDYELPDYLEDLNAMHKAEKVLTESQQSEFADRLNSLHEVADLTYPDPDKQGFRKDLFSEAFHLIHATAAQRAEAFLKTLNLWES